VDRWRVGGVSRVGGARRGVYVFKRIFKEIGKPADDRCGGYPAGDLCAGGGRDSSGEVSEGKVWRRIRGARAQVLHLRVCMIYILILYTIYTYLCIYSIYILYIYVVCVA